MEEGSGCKSLSFSETTRRDLLRDYRAHVTRLINGKLKYVRVIMFYLTFQGCTAVNNGKSHPAQRPVLCSRGHPTFQFRAYFHSLNEPEFAEVKRKLCRHERQSATPDLLRARRTSENCVGPGAHAVPDIREAAQEFRGCGAANSVSGTLTSL